MTTLETLNAQFEKLNKQYVKFSKQMDKLSAQGYNTWELEDKLDAIQEKMCKISNEIENLETL